MYLRYGNYSHANGEVALNISRDTILSNEQIPTGIRETWQIEGRLLPTTTQTINSLIAGLSSAYSYDGLDLALYDENGSRTSLFLLSNQCVGGTLVIQHPSFPTSRNAALVTNMPYRIVVRGERPITTPESLTVSWNESISRSGGGRQIKHIETLYTRPVPQIVRTHTTYRAVQSGSAIGRFSYPTPPPPIWPYAQVEAPKTMQRTPKRRQGGDLENYEITWNYTFESTVPLIGGPTTL